MLPLSKILKKISDLEIQSINTLRNILKAGEFEYSIQEEMIETLSESFQDIRLFIKQIWINNDVEEINSDNYNKNNRQDLELYERVRPPIVKRKPLNEEVKIL